MTLTKTLLTSLTLTLVSLLLPRVSSREAPVVVVDYPGFVSTVGVGVDFDTGERFGREAFVLFHKSGVCDADFEKENLASFGNYPQMFVLVSVDADHATEELLSKFHVDGEELNDIVNCPIAMVVPYRSRVDAPAFDRLAREPKAQGMFYTAAVRSQLVNVGVINEMDFPLDILYVWWDEPMRPTHVKNLAPGRENWMSTFKSTVLIAVNRDSGEEVQRYMVFGHGLFTVADRSCNVETCGNSEGRQLENDNASREARLRADRGRESNNIIQPRGLPTFTELGFRRERVPDDVWDAVKTYYEENKYSPKKEVWGQHNVFTNSVEAPSYMVTLPENGILKSKIFEGIRPILEEWSGVELVQTACYGIRVYTNTSWLANHVDTRATHAISVIIQVDQDVEEDWPLMIYDHAGNNYNFTMHPRDMMLYESATCVHGRPSTFNGRFYANSFVHFKPKDDSKWIQER